ncbi:hypothetical protein F5884DRAFT_857691 [Xylogone sp. PMI_703]|nr:hypothetical protein F5884DRAFT_857691 [Xylogone sp. PMI_703]
MQQTNNDATLIASSNNDKGCWDNMGDGGSRINLPDPFAFSSLAERDLIMKTFQASEKSAANMANTVARTLSVTEAISKIHMTIRVLVEENNLLRPLLQVSAATYGPVGALLTVSDGLWLKRPMQLAQVTGWLQAQLDNYTESKNKRKLLVKSIEIRIGSKSYTHGFPSIDGDLVAPDRLLYDADDVRWDSSNVLREQYWTAFMDLLLIGSNVVPDRPVIKVRTIRQRRTQISATSAPRLEESQIEHADRHGALSMTPAMSTSNLRPNVTSASQLRGSAPDFNTKKEPDAGTRGPSNTDSEDTTAIERILEKLGVSDSKKTKAVYDPTKAPGWSNPLPKFGLPLHILSKKGTGSSGKNNIWRYQQCQDGSSSHRLSNQTDTSFEPEVRHALESQTEDFDEGTGTYNINNSTGARGGSEASNVEDKEAKALEDAKAARIAQYWEGLEKVIGFESDDDETFFPYPDPKSKEKSQPTPAENPKQKFQPRSASATRLDKKAFKPLPKNEVSSHDRGRSTGAALNTSYSEGLQESNLIPNSRFGGPAFNHPLSHLQYLNPDRPRSMSPSVSIGGYNPGTYENFQTIQQRAFTPQPLPGMEYTDSPYGEHLQHLPYGSEAFNTKNTILASYMNYIQPSGNQYRNQ